MSYPRGLIMAASNLAQSAHEGQVRKYTGEPYWHHCRRVAELVISIGGTPEEIAAAWLHDVVEDTAITLDRIREAYGPIVAGLVEELTDVYTPEAYPTWNRARRKAEEARRLSTVSASAKRIKLCDVMDNSLSIDDASDDFVAVWQAERAYLLACLRGSG